MSPTLPQTRKEIYDSLSAAMQASFGGILNLLRYNFFDANAIAVASLLFQVYEQLQALLAMMFPDTAEGSFAIRWGSFKGYFPLTAKPASGDISITGTIGAEISINTVYIAGTGEQYKTTETKQIAQHVLSVIQIIRVGSTATASFSSPHKFTEGMSVTFAGADQAEYNGTFNVTIPNAEECSYTVSGTPTTPATGTITATAVFADTNIKADNAGSITNLASGISVTLQTPIPNVDNTSLVQEDGIVGGSDAEDINTEYKPRYKFGYANPPSHFNAYAINELVLKQPEVTRSKTFNVTPEIGDVSIYPIYDNRAHSVPTVTDLENIKSVIPVPPGTPSAQIHVNAFDPVPVDFTFISLLPNTASMQNAINNSLAAMFKTIPEVSSNLLRLDYEAAIHQTIDPTNGDKVRDFTLDAPSGDIPIGVGQMATLGNITYV